MTEMNGRERVLTTLQHQEPDRVPTFEWEVHIAHKMTSSGTYDDFIEQCDIDAVTSYPDYLRKPISSESYVDEWGVTRSKTHAHDDLAPIKTMADVEKFVPPDPYAPHRFENIKRLIKKYKGERAIIMMTRDVWGNPRDLFGYVELFVKCHDAPDVVEALVEKVVDHSIALIHIAAELGVEVVMSNDDIADNRRTLISLETFDSVFLPHFRRFSKAVRDCGMYHWKHTDGNISTVLERFVDAGIHGIDPVDPIAGMTLKSFKEQWGDKIAIKGNMDQAYLLMTGTEAQVREAVKQCIRDAGQGGGYVCSSSNIIHEGVRPELYKVMLDAIREYGRYPLDMDMLAPDPNIIVPNPAKKMETDPSRRGKKRRPRRKRN